MSVWSVFFTGAGQGKKNEVNGTVCLISCKNQENLSIEKVILKQEICKIKEKEISFIRFSKAHICRLHSRIKYIPFTNNVPDVAI